MIKNFFGHLHTVNKHRWEVFKISIRLGIPLRGLVHDLSKYSPTEFFESVKYYTGGTYSPLLACKRANGYSKAWLHHKGRNKHHYEYWYDVAAEDKTPIIPLKYMIEMICDRIAATKTYNRGNFQYKQVLEYYYKEEPRMTLNPKLKKFLEAVFKDLSKNGNKNLNKKFVSELYYKYTK